ncbi:formate transporter FocA [Shewanella eurypsychrophilus]|uniref:Formate transporter FocA n=1 Tax=Shewanella eurypsychrophilus TaxID=2593656 RepID=A0ABX6V967_9GAMM|nr:MULTISPECIES: formate transporter FocA [Shewanella]QFU23325.1 formate transporter FocA [Shewanella sp. YLB-09]QPG58554.1 formate transporter FocA [Shewanella eurypsychrophilus]
MNNNPSPFDASTPAVTAKKVEDAAVVKVNRDTISTLLLAITAGVFIGLAFVFYIAVTAGGSALPYGLNKLIGGLCFSLGLMLVVILGGELFTSTVLTIIAKASNRVSTLAVLRNWTLVYLGNFIGAMLLVGLMISAKHYEAGHGLIGLGYLQSAQAKLQYTFGQAFTLGIMCNVMVCLAVWMAYAGRTVTDKLLAVVLPVAMFVAAGFEHCIANMFLIPMAIITKLVATPEFWANAGVDPSLFADLTWSQFLLHNLVPVTLGNIVGGAIFVGLTYWFVYRRPELDKANNDNR